VVRTARVLNGDDQLKRVPALSPSHQKSSRIRATIKAYEIAVVGRASLFRRPLRTTPHRLHPSYSRAHPGDAADSCINTDRGRAGRRAHLCATDNNHLFTSHDANRSGQPTAGTRARTRSSAASAAAPTIAINGANPAVIHVGDTYADPGPTITGPTADLNLGIKTFLNGTLVSNIVLDTTAAATDTIDYVATDSAGLTSTSTRTVLIESAPPLVPTDNASTAAATSTAQ
jgi:hypothetical protein